MDSDSLPYSGILNEIGFIFLQSNVSYYIAPVIISIIVLLILSAIISGSEVAFFSLSPSQLEELKESDNKTDKVIINLIESPRQLLATILISNNFVNISIILLFNFLMNLLFDGGTNNFLELIFFGQVINLSSTVIISVLNIALLTPILVFFGEVSPKVFANHNNLLTARSTAKFFSFLRTVSYPFAWILAKSGLIIERKFEKQNNEIDLEEIEKAIDLSTNDGSSKEDIDILKGIVHFGNTTVKKIMVPRVDIAALKTSLNFKEVIAKVTDAGYSRMPVFEQSIDKIEGILYLKDLLEYLDKPDDFAWQKLVRDPFFIPETKKIDDLLREIQENRKHQAIVVDEYGGTKGLVTLEDILEEVLGDIKDEFDEDYKTSFRKLHDGSYIIDGKLPLGDLTEMLEIDEHTFDEVKGENDTLAGLLLELSGELPQKGAKFSYNNYHFSVLSMERHRIDKVKLQIHA